MIDPEDGQGWLPHPAQEGLLAARAAGQGVVSHCAYLLAGRLDEQRLGRAYEEAFRSFDSLSLRWSGSAMGGRWLPTGATRAEVLRRDLRSFEPLWATDPLDGPAPFPGARPEGHLDAFAGVGFSSAFLTYLQAVSAPTLDISSGPVAQVCILRVGTSSWVIVEAIDHLMADGRSMALLHERVSDLYGGPDRTSTGASLTPTGPSHPVPDAVLASYTALLAPCDSPADGEALRPSPALIRTEAPHTHHTGAGALQQTITLPAPAVARITRSVAEMRSTLAAALLCGHAHALARHLGTADTATFVAVDVRSDNERDVFGHLTALVPVRLRHNWAMPLREHLPHATRALLSARDHLTHGHVLHTKVSPSTSSTLSEIAPTVPPALVRDFSSSAGPSSNPPDSVAARLGDPAASAFVIQPYADLGIDLPGATCTRIELESSDQAGGLATVARQRKDGSLDLTIRTPPGSLLREHLTSFAATLHRTLLALESDPDLPLGSDELLPPDARLTIDANAHPSTPYPTAVLHEDIQHQLLKAGARTAVEDENGHHSAAQLAAAVTTMARELSALSIGPCEQVWVGPTTAFQRIAAFLAVQNAGATYVPYDSPEPPPNARVDALIDAAGARRPPATPEWARFERVPAADSTGPPAYIIFTSGTTGTPKGVAVSRASLANLARGEADRFDIDPTSRVLLIAPPTVDPWICHVSGALLAGAALIAVNAATENSLITRMRAERITHAFLPAALLRGLAGSTRDVPSLKMIASAGEACLACDLAPFDGTRIFNIYGPTEGTVTATIADLSDPYSRTDPLPIGRPIRGTGARVVIDRQASAPPGVPGELALSGAGVALGYLPDLGDEPPFGEDPFAPGTRWYCTGDRVVLRADGQFLHLGRIDRQLKIRGNRVEPESVERAAVATGLCSAAHTYATPPVTPAAAQSTGSPGFAGAQLILFAENCTSPALLMERLRQSLAPPAVPHHVVSVAQLPRQPNGKIDESRLTELLTASRPGQGSTEAVPETSLSRIWADVLGVPPGPRDSFFDSGGDSLTVLHLVSRARLTGLHLSPADVYEHPRYMDLERLLVSADATGNEAGGATTNGHSPPGPAQAWFQHLGLPLDSSWVQLHAMPFTALPTRQRLRDALTRLVAATPTLRSRFDPRDGSLRLIDRADPDIAMIDAASPDSDIAKSLRQLVEQIDPLRGVMLQAAALPTSTGGGVVVLAAHHLVVDVWSWSIIEERLRAEVASPADDTTPRDDIGFAQLADAFHRQRRAGAFHSELAFWQAALRSGATADIKYRPSHLQRLRRTFPAPTGLNEHGRVPASRLALAALGDALHATFGDGATVIDLERNGRTCVDGLDLSSAVGWIGLHHPLTIAHRPHEQAALDRVAQDLEAIADSGLGYPTLRWATPGALISAHVGRFGVNITNGHVHRTGSPERSGPLSRSTPANLRGLLDRIRPLLQLPSPGLSLPYEASLIFRTGSDHWTVSLEFDPDRLPPPAAGRLLDALGSLSASKPTRPVNPQVLFPVRAEGAGTRPGAAGGTHSAGRPELPVSAMQHLMLHYSGQGAGTYIPRQIVAIDVPHLSGDAFVDEMERSLGEFEPLRRRFGAGPAGPCQFWSPDSTVSIRRQGGGIADALAWIEGRDRVTSESVMAGGRPYALGAYLDGGRVLLTMETHHALMDGQSNNELLRLISHIARRHPSLEGRDQTEEPAGESSLWPPVALRKHVSCEQAVGAEQPAQPSTVRPAPERSSVSLKVRGADAHRIADWAIEIGVDLRAGLGGIIASIASEIFATERLFTVVNGRDIDIPGSQKAFGMFWYFDCIPILPTTSQRHARQIFTSASVPLSQVRKSALQWASWPVNGAAYNFTKEADPTGNRNVQVLSSRDAFHFAHQVNASLRHDGSLQVTVLSSAKDVQRFPGLLLAAIDRI